MLGSNSSARKNRRQKFVTLSDSEDELSALPVRPDTRRRGRQQMPPAEEAVSLDDDSDEIVTTSPVKRRPKPIVLEDEDDDSEEIVSPLKRRREPSVDLESDLEISPSKRRRGGSNVSINQHPISIIVFNSVMNRSPRRLPVKPDNKSQGNVPQRRRRWSC